MGRRRSKEASSSTPQIEFVPELVESEVGEIVTLPGPSTQPKKVYYCNLCGKEFQSFQAMGGHMNMSTHQVERAAIRERAKRMAIIKASVERKAMEDEAKKVATVIAERAKRKAMEDTAKELALLEQRAERNKVKEELNTACKQPPIHYFVELPFPVELNCETTHDLYSPNHPSLSRSSSASTFYIFLESKIDEEYKNEKKSDHAETSIQLALIGRKRKRSNEHHDVELGLGHSLDLELKL